MIGKGRRSDKIKELLKKYKSIYLVSVGGISAYLSTKVKDIKIIAYSDLGAEAVHEIVVEDLPLFVAYDIYGGDIFDDFGIRGAGNRGYVEEVIGCKLVPVAGANDKYYYSKKVNFKSLKEIQVAGQIHDAEVLIDFSHVKGHGACSYGGACKNIDQPNAVDPMNWGRDYVTGALCSERTNGVCMASAFMGYFECKMLMQHVTGSWPAFWFLTVGNHAGGTQPYCDEYDCVEAYGGSDAAAYKAYMVARHAWSYSDPDGNGILQVFVDGIGGGGSEWEGFHTFGFLCTPNTLYWYYDNIQVWSGPTNDVTKYEALAFLINNEIGGGWPVDLTRYGNVSDMWVDWVRVYQ